MPLDIVPFPDTNSATDFLLREQQIGTQQADMMGRLAAESAARQQAESHFRQQQAFDMLQFQRQQSLSAVQQAMEQQRIDLEGRRVGIEAQDAAPFTMPGGGTAADAVLGSGDSGGGDLASGVLGANYHTGNATTFGLNPDGSIDRQDNGVGAWGADTRDPSLVGVALHPADLAAAGIPRSQWKNATVAAENPANGKTITAPVVDLLGNPGAAADLTYGATKALGTDGKTPIQFNIIGPNGTAAPHPAVSLDGPAGMVMGADEGGGGGGGMTPSEIVAQRVRETLAPLQGSITNRDAKQLARQVALQTMGQIQRTQAAAAKAGGSGAGPQPSEIINWPTDDDGLHYNPDNPSERYAANTASNGRISFRQIVAKEHNVGGTLVDDKGNVVFQGNAAPKIGEKEMGKYRDALKDYRDKQQAYNEALDDYNQNGNDWRGTRGDAVKDAKKAMDKAQGEIDSFHQLYPQLAGNAPKTEQGPKTAPDSVMDAARAAIKAGKDPNAVKKRLAENGYDTSGL